MISPKHDLRDFVRLMTALDPWLKDLVIVGGWAYRLYRIHPLAQELGYPPIITLDTDIALPAKLPARDPDIRQRLLKGGFEEELLGDHRPPVTHYRSGGGTSGFYAEFLTPLTGSIQKRNKKASPTTRIAGVTSQKLRYLELLFQSPWSVVLNEAAGFPVLKPTTVRIANPAGYAAHKLLIYSRRPPNERAKDILYIHDTIEVFGSSLDRLRADWQNTIKVHLHETALSVINRAINSLFRDVTDVIREATLMAVGRNLRPELVTKTCHDGLAKIFLP